MNDVVRRADHAMRVHIAWLRVGAQQREARLLTQLVPQVLDLQRGRGLAGPHNTSTISPYATTVRPSARFTSGRATPWQNFPNWLLSRITVVQGAKTFVSSEQAAMDDLLPTLHAHHRAIGEIVDTINVELAKGDVAAVQGQLVRLKSAVLAHLALEDAQLYPALTQAARETKLAVPTRVAMTYERNMEHVSAALKAFLEEYTQPQVQPSLDDLKRDWELVARMLVDRMESEEDQLYPLYRSWVLGASSPRP